MAETSFEYLGNLSRSELEALFWREAKGLSPGAAFGLLRGLACEVPVDMRSRLIRIREALRQYWRCPWFDQGERGTC